jgi:putative ABC transport system permease protein
MTIGSLIISFSGMIILVLYVSFEKSYDRFNKNYQSVYRIETQQYGSHIPAVMGVEIKNNIPEIESLTTVFFNNEHVSTPGLYASNISYPSEMLYCDNHLFDIFTLPLLLGDKSNLLNNPNLAILSETLARKLFGQLNPLGEDILISNQKFRVSGIIKDFPLNSSFRPDCLISFATLVEKDQTLLNSNWGDWRYNIFIKILDKANPEMIIEKISKLPEIKSVLPKVTGKERIEKDFFSLLPLSEIHLKEEENYNYTNPFTLNVLIGLIFVLALMGAVNFINFTTSQAHVRANALAITRLLGANRFSVKNQIIAESVILSTIALIVSLIIYYILSIPLENIFGINGIALGNRYNYLIYFFVFAVLFGIITAIYPSNYITSAPPVLVIKGIYKMKNNSNYIRDVLLTVQFIFAIGLISAAFVMEKQLSFWNKYDIGFKKDEVVYFYTSTEHSIHSKALADELMKNQKISAFTYSAFVPGQVNMGWTREVDGQFIDVESWPVDANFMDFFGFKITQGRQFEKTTQADENSFILNEKAISKFGWSNPLEKRINGWDSEGPVIGVVKDFNFSSLREEIKPMMFWLTNKFSSRILILKIKDFDISETVSYIKKTAQLVDPKNPVDIKFLDDTLNKLYEKEEKTARFIEFIAIWCVLLGIAGLLGLIVFTCKARTKEIGIRKVNGAKAIEVMIMLNKDLLKWVVIAFVFSTPISWYIMHKWLENFAYKITLSWWIFSLAGLLTLCLAILTVSCQSWKVVTRNPVVALRYE